MNAWVAEIMSKNAAISKSQAHLEALREAQSHDFQVQVQMIVPIVPGVVLIRWSFSSLFNPGGVAGGGVEQYSLVVPYAFDSRILYSWKLASWP